MTFMNIGTVAENVLVRTYASSGQPLPIPVVGSSFESDHQFQVLPGGSVQLDLDQLASPLTVGWAQVVAGLNIRGQGIYTQVVPGRPTSQAVVPLVTRDPSRCIIAIPGDTSSNPDVLVMPFDNVEHSTSHAFANTSDVPRTLALKFLDTAGTALFSREVNLLGHGQVAFDTTQYPELRGKRGQVVVQNEAADWTAIGFLFDGVQNTFTTTLPIVR